MHVSALSVDLNWLVQFVFTAFVIALGLLHIVKNTASKYFVVDANFEGGAGESTAALLVSDNHRSRMPGVSGAGDACAICGDFGKKQCSGCKLVRYCSQKCQREHWQSGHNKKCKDSHNKSKPGFWGSSSTRVALVPKGETFKALTQSNKILFPYDEFVKFFNWDNPGFPPCGLLNCGNSCFANVVLQCLAYTRPLVAYLLEKGHRKECRRNDWCFLCEFQAHVERASQSLHPFSPINILSRLPNIGGNLGCGKQEDAHELMRFAIDTMQSVCLDEFGGEKAIHPSTQETTLIQHIFGGRLQSQVICTNCNKISNQYENMMDLTVEIHGDAASLEECLDQFTVKEWLHGENMYKCDGCNDYVKAWKRLTVRRAPNILTIALKRFQSGRFGKLNKRVAFPETLDLTPYMTEALDGTDVYKLYAVVVHVDMLNASFFGHYICYIKDFSGNWYRIDDCKVVNVELEEVLSQGAYMLLYSRVCARPSCLMDSIEASNTGEQLVVNTALDLTPSTKHSVDCVATAEPTYPISVAGILPTASIPIVEVSHHKEISLGSDSETPIQDPEDDEMVDPCSSSSVFKEIEVYGNGQSNTKKNACPAPAGGSLAQVSGIVSCSSETSLAEARNMKCEFPFSTLDIDLGNGVNSDCVREVVSLNPVEIPVPTQNGVCEKPKASHSPVATSSAVEESLNEVNPLRSNSMPISCPKKLEKDKSADGLQSSSFIYNGAGKSVGGNSSTGVKLKPVFASGFLGKRPRNKSMKRDGNSSLESGKLEIACRVDSTCNGALKPDFLNQKGEETQDQAKAHVCCNGFSSVSLVQEQLGNEVEMIDINITESRNISDGDANSAIADENISDIMMNDAEEKRTLCGQIDKYLVGNGFPRSLDIPLAENSVAIDGEVHELSTTVHSGISGTASQRLDEGEL